MSELLISETELVQPAGSEPDAAATAPRRGASARALAALRGAVRRPSLTLAVLAILLVLVWAVAPGLFTHWDPLVGDVSDRLQGPSVQHVFGTDNLGRDLWARVVYGAADSLASTALAVALALVVGSFFGLIAGFVRGWVDDAIMRVMDVVLAIPSVLLSLAIITALGFGTVNVAIAVGFASAASFALVMRSEVISISTALYVEAARASGVRWYTVLRRHVLPNSLGPVLALSALEFGTAVLAISSLSFLGFGAPPPAPEWGALISEGRNYLAIAWWLTTFPGLVIVAIVLAANRISHAVEKNGGTR